MVTRLPGAAGLEESTSRYAASSMTPGPDPCPLMLNMPGEKGARFTVCVAPLWPQPVAVTVACGCPANSQGIWRFTWDPAAKNTGAGNPPKFTDTPARLGGSGRPGACTGAYSGNEPKTETMLPGEDAAPAKLAAFTTPAGLMAGASEEAQSGVWPIAAIVSANALYVGVSLGDPQLLWARLRSSGNRPVWMYCSTAGPLALVQTWSFPPRMPGVAAGRSSKVGVPK